MLTAQLVGYDLSVALLRLCFGGAGDLAPRALRSLVILSTWQLGWSSAALFSRRNEFLSCGGRAGLWFGEKEDIVRGDL